VVFAITAVDEKAPVKSENALGVVVALVALAEGALAVGPVKQPASGSARQTTSAGWGRRAQLRSEGDMNASKKRMNENDFP
jgi:hypothetical protein